MAAQLENRGGMTETPPPPYEISTPNHENQQSPAPNGDIQQQQGPATNGACSREDTQLQAIKFLFCPDPSICWTSQDWGAILFVKCSDVPRLMREGLYWDAENIITEDGYVQRNLDRGNGIYPHPHDEKPWDGVRYYFLRDLQQPPRWTASIEVYSSSYETLHHFDFSQLSREKIRSGEALNQSRELIYEYYHGQPQQCYNAIYDNMPMEGQWPWPRKDDEVNRKK
ncbi:hypothetical protein F5X97DRAFT_337349 [Nemania serpens]|nr:hypothetical protein F5X97DRAFT_337349 [Nemania serpens]